MRVPVEWLDEYCSPDMPVDELATRLAMTGTEVDRVEHHGVRELDNFVVGRVLSAEPHPDADRLKVCVVDIGAGQESQIVCGAPNVAAGQTVAVARPGSVMPDGTKLKKAKLRGQESAGMILAEDELGIGMDHAGTMVLAGDHAPGTPLEGVLPLSTDVLELEITPNRPDCLAVYGVAREAHAATGAELAPPPWADDPGAADAPASGVGVEIVVEAPDLCPRFTARAFEDVTIGPSPPWLKARLMACGQRPINNVVDITNYAMLLTGQPMHAFDLDRIEGRRLVVRRATDGEQVVTLDDQTRTVDSEVCLIADAAGPTSIAGVMGGNRSEVQADTTRVLMEAANWNAPNIHATSLKLGLRSEASARFEKGLAPEQALDGQAVATRLMLDLTGARLVPGTVDVAAQRADESADLVLRLRDAKVVALLGVAITRSESAMHLGRLGFRTAERPDGLDVTVPYFRRNDVTREADLVEEVARLHGVNDQLPATLPRRRGAIGVLTPEQRLRRRAEDVLVGRGLLEVVGWSFESVARDAQLRLPDDDPRRAHVVIENPMSEDESRHAHDAARLHAGRRAPQRRTRAAPDGHLRVRPCVPRHGCDAAPRAPRARRARPRRHLRRQGLPPGAAGDAARAGRVRRRSAAVPAPRPQRRGARRRRAGRLGRRRASARRPPRGISTASPRSRSTSTRSPGTLHPSRSTKI